MVESTQVARHATSQRALAGRRWYWLLTLLFGATVLPFLLLGFLVLPGSADYESALVTLVDGPVYIPFLVNLLPGFLTHLSIWPACHPLLAPLLLAVWALAWWAVLRQVPGLKRPRDTALATLAALALWLTHWPALGEGLYQFADAWSAQQGALSLVGMFAFSLLWASAPVPIRPARLVLIAVGFLFLVNAHGMATMMVAVPGLLVTGALIAPSRHQRALWLVALFIAVPNMVMVLLWTAPKHAEALPQFGTLAGHAALAALLLLMQWGGDLGWWLAVLALLPLGVACRRQYPVLARLPVWRLVGGAVALLVVLFAALLAGFAVYGARLPKSVLNGLCCGTLLGLAALVVLAVARAPQQRPWGWSGRTWHGLHLLLALSLLCVGSQSGLAAWRLLLVDAPAYHQALLARQAALKAAVARGEHEAEVAPLPPMPWLAEAELAPQAYSPPNHAWATAFGLAAVRLAPSPAPVPAPLRPGPAPAPPTTLSAPLPPASTP